MGVACLEYRGPLFVPYVRMTRRSKGYDKRAILYIQNQRDIKKALSAQWGNFAPLDKNTAIDIEAMLYVNSWVMGDGDNLLKSILDAANGIIYTDDRYVVSAGFTKCKADVPGFGIVLEWWKAPWARGSGN